MNQPTYTQFTERMYARLPEVVREADALNDYALKRYISTIGDVEDQVERLIARFTYLDKQSRLTLDSLADDYSYYGLDYSYFQATDSKRSAQIASNNNESVFLRSMHAYMIVPNTTIYVGAVFRTDRQEPLNTYGLRLWYYDASMNLISTKDVGRNNGSTGPQWVVVNSTDSTPDTAYYVRVSPFGQNTSGTSAKLWVDDVYARSHYEVTTTNNLVSGGHNFTMRAEHDLVRQGDFDAVWGLDELTDWDLGPDVNLMERSLDGVPDIQSYRNWLELGSTNASQPGYARQVVQGVVPSSTYTISLLALRDADVLDASAVRVTVTPNTGGPAVRTFSMEGYERNMPFLLTFTWNSPETVSTAIVSVEYVTDTMPARGLLINDVSVVRFTSDVTQIGRQGTPVTFSTTERAGAEMFVGRDVRGEGWIRYATQGDPDGDPMPTDEPDNPSGTSFIEASWHQSRPGNTYTFSGEIFSNHGTNYVDLIIWHRNEGKGWGDVMLHRIYASSLNGWVRFERTIIVPSGATEFRVNLDVYRGSSERVLNLRNVSLVPTSNRSWYMSGARPFGYNALTTKAMNFLSRGDLLHYTANLMVTGNPGSGRYGVRVYSNGSQVVHETTISTAQRNQLVPITGSFQVPEDQAELRVALFVNDPTPVHQAAYFLSDLEVVHSTQQFVDDPQNLIRNGGFEIDPITTDWQILTERTQDGQSVYAPPVNGSAYLTTAFGYNKEDVPARPKDVPLGATSDLVDPRTANTEWLPWLAQFAGKNISHFSTMEDARIALASGNNFSAGTIGAIQNAVQAVLTGTKTVRVFPMTTALNAIGKATQWDVSIVTRTSESPDISVMEETVRLRNAKPAGVVFHFHKHQSTWDAVELANPTWDVWDTRTWTQLEESGLED